MCSHNQISVLYELDEFTAGLVMWMNEDDYQLLLNVDLASAIDRFIHRYKTGPILLNRTSFALKSSTISSLSSSSSSESHQISHTESHDAACEEANQIVNRIEMEMKTNQDLNQRNTKCHLPSLMAIFDLIITLSRATFLHVASPPHTSTLTTDPGSLTYLIGHHIPIRDVDVMILEYLDSSVHGEGGGLTLIKRILPCINLPRLTDPELQAFVAAINHLAQVLSMRPMTSIHRICDDRGIHKYSYVVICHYYRQFSKL
jgi:hypothetical protein